MTGLPTTAAPTNEEALLAVLFSILQITPAQHDQIGRMLSRNPPTAIPAPAPMPANVAEWAAPHPAPPAHSPSPPDLPPLIRDPNPPWVRMPVAPMPPPTAPLPPPNPPYGPLSENAVVVPEGHDYHVPHPTKRGPFYMIVRGLDIGIFAGWEDAAALVIGVSGSIYCKVPNVHVGCVRLDTALAGHGAAWLP